MKTIKIFIASSNELRMERLEFTDMIQQLNRSLKRCGIELEPVKWEYLDCSMNAERKQAEYNQALQECELCLVLYWTRFGEYTEEELTTAWEGLKSGANPRKLYVYFKEPGEMSRELQEFKEQFATRYGHFYCKFENVDTLKVNFLLQVLSYLDLEELKQKTVEISSGMVSLQGEPFADLRNVPFMAANQQHADLKKQISGCVAELNTLAPESDDYAQQEERIRQLEEKRARMERQIWDTAVQLTEMATQKCGKRMEDAMRLFNEGRASEALAVLNVEEMDEELNRATALAEKQKEHLKSIVNEYRLRINIISSQMEEGWEAEADGLFRKAIVAANGNTDELYYGNLLLGYTYFLINQNRLADAEPYVKEAYDLFSRLFNQTQSHQAREGLAHAQDHLIECYLRTGRADLAAPLINELQNNKKVLLDEAPEDYLEAAARHQEMNASLCWHQDGRPLKARTWYKRAKENWEKLYAMNPAYGFNLAVVNFNIGCTTLNATDDREEALTSFREVERLYITAPEAEKERWQDLMKMTFFNISDVSIELQRLDEALVYAEKCRAIEKDENTEGLYQYILQLMGK